jgi:hypothetical protein
LHEKVGATTMNRNNSSFQLHDSIPPQQGYSSAPRRNRLMSALLLAVYFIGLFFISFFATQFIALNLRSQISSSNQSTIDTTPIPATSTHNPTVSLDDATLGGTLDAFTQKYGRAIGNGTIFETHQDGLSIDMVLTGDTGKDGKKRVNAINIVAGDTNGNQVKLPSHTRDVLLAALFPPDAMHVGDVPGDKFTDHIFTSQRLAATFDASIFISDAGENVPSGTFDWVCFNSDSSGASDFCLLATGENAKPTK